MNIGIDISQIAYPGSGVARFTGGLLTQILSTPEEHTWHLYFYSLRAGIDPDLKEKIAKKTNVTLHTFLLPQSILSFATYQARSVFSWMLTSLPSLRNLDWFVTSDWLELPIRTRRATIVHDLVFRKYPDTVHPHIRHIQERRLSCASAESDLFITDSLSTRHDLENLYPILKKKTQVIYPGVTPLSLKKNGLMTEKVRNQTIGSPYILSVGKREPRKNIGTLVEAFRLQKKIRPDLKLVIVGPYGWGKEQFPHEKEIIITGFLKDEELCSLYQNAECFVFPSLYEGFGYPIVEAMMNACPVITSHVSSLPEVAGDAAMYCDSSDPKSISDAMTQLLSNTSLRHEMIAKGLKRASTFTWERYYNKLIQALS